MFNYLLSLKIVVNNSIGCGKVDRYNKYSKRLTKRIWTSCKIVVDKVLNKLVGLLGIKKVKR